MKRNETSVYLSVWDPNEFDQGLQLWKRALEPVSPKVDLKRMFQVSTETKWQHYLSSLDHTGRPRLLLYAKRIREKYL